MLIFFLLVTVRLNPAIHNNEKMSHQVTEMTHHIMTDLETLKFNSLS